MHILAIFDGSLPLTNPVLKFLLLLLIIFFTPLIFNRIKIPHLLGLIIAGAAIGPNGFNLIERDSGLLLYVTAGLLYIMFLAGIEIDMGEFKKNSWKSFVFGMYTFLIPMGLGTYLSIYLLGFSVPTSILLASMFASHTLIAYPIISKMGLAKDKAVNVAIGGTVITDTLALLVLAVIVGMSTGEVNEEFWIRLSVSMVIFIAVILFVFPFIARWFFKRINDNVSQYIFIMVLVFLGSVLAEIAGIEAIIGAFFTGLALNRLIPHTSPLMNRIEFVGNAIFIPFFLIGVGMLINFRVFVQDMETIIVAVFMTIVATFSKFTAAWLAQKTFRFTKDQRRLIFGLSNAQAPATLAAVIVGYNVIIGYDASGEPIRLLSESILNGTIVMILVTCTIAGFSAQKGAQNISIREAADNAHDDQVDIREKILIPLSSLNLAEDLVNLSVTIKSRKNKSGLYGLHIISESNPDELTEKQARKLLDTASVTAAATDNKLFELIRYDQNIVNGMAGVIKEHKITDMVIGLNIEKGMSDNFLSNLNDGILNKSNVTTLIYKPSQPLGTIKRHLIIVPDKAEKEIGFPFWLLKIWNIARNTGAKLKFHGSEETLSIIREIHKNHPIECEFETFVDWEDFLIISRDMQKDDNLIVILSRKEKPSFHTNMRRIPVYLNKYFQELSFILIYPIQAGVSYEQDINLRYASMLEPLEKLDDIGKTIVRIFKKK